MGNRKYEVQGKKYEVPSTKWEMGSTDQFRIQNSELCLAQCSKPIAYGLKHKALMVEMGNGKSEVRSTKYKVGNLKYKVQNGKCEVQV